MLVACVPPRKIQMTTKAEKPTTRRRWGRWTNIWHYREKVRVMPRMKNSPPYDSNEIVHWFAQLYQCDLKQGQKHFGPAGVLSRHSAKHNSEKWPPFLLFDHGTGEWHGADTR